jgi:hypothetical protein
LIKQQALIRLRAGIKTEGYPDLLFGMFIALFKLGLAEVFWLACKNDSSWEMIVRREHVHVW